MDTHARGALAVCLLLAGCQSPMFPSFGRTNRTVDTAALASARAAGSGSARHADTDDEGGRLRPVSHDQSRPAGSPRQSVADALEQAREADMRGQHELARSHYQRVLQLDPSHADALHALGILADKQGDFRTAETQYLTALRSKPEDANLLSDIGYSYFLQARRHDAEWYLREALKYDPQHAKARGNLELLFDEQKAHATYIQLLGEREAAARMSALFPQSAPAQTRVAAAARPVSYDFEGPAAAGGGTHPAAYQQTRPADPNASAWPADPRASYGQPDHRTPTDYLRAEMQRERDQAAAMRQHQARPAAPHVAPDAFDSARAFAEPGPSAAGQAIPPQSHYAQSPYGQWAEPAPAHAPASFAPQPMATGGSPELWPHAPAASQRESIAPALSPAGGARPTRTAADQTPFGSDSPATSQAAGRQPSFTGQDPTGGFSYSDVSRTAQRVGLEGGSLFPPASAGRPARPSGFPAAEGASQATATSRAADWNHNGQQGAPGRSPAGVQTADAWENPPAGHYSPAAVHPAAAQQPPQILITPGASGLAPAPAPAASAWPTDRSWPSERSAGQPHRTPARYATEQQPGMYSTGPAPAAAPRWEQQGYGIPAPGSAQASPATPAGPPYWRQDSGVSGWNGQ